MRRASVQHCYLRTPFANHAPTSLRFKPPPLNLSTTHMERPKNRRKQNIGPGWPSRSGYGALRSGLSSASRAACWRLWCTSSPIAPATFSKQPIPPPPAPRVWCGHHPCLCDLFFNTYVVLDVARALNPDFVFQLCLAFFFALFCWHAEGRDCVCSFVALQPGRSPKRASRT